MIKMAAIDRDIDDLNALIKKDQILDIKYL